MHRQLFGRQGRPKVGVSFAHQRQRQGEPRPASGDCSVYRGASRSGHGTGLFETAQQAKHLTPLQADQFARVCDTQSTGLNPQQDLKPAELLLAH
jgi:hypothetical protein